MVLAQDRQTIQPTKKKLSTDNLKFFKDKFNLPLSDEDIEKLPFLTFDEKSKEYKYLTARRKELGGFLPKRETIKIKLLPASEDHFNQFNDQSNREMSTTMAFVRLLTSLLRDNNIGKHVVPIVPDEARTFGMDGLFRQFGIYSSEGQKYTPEDADKVMWYRESKDGVMLEEGINEAGAFSAWLALATSYSSHSLAMIPFYIYYSMFGFQRIHDLAWAAGDARAKGFLLGATSGRTTLNGEGLQHQDGHSHIFAQTIPNCRSYDPCFDYELAAIIKHGIDDMYVKNNDNYYYLTLMNENYIHPQRPKGLLDESIINGAYKFLNAENPKIRLLASGVTVRFAEKAASLLEKYDIAAEVWSVTSFNELARGGVEAERLRHIGSSKKQSYVEACFSKEIPTIAVSEYMRNHTEQIRRWVKGKYFCLGTDGFGRSDTRENLRKFFEIDENNIVYSALKSLEMHSEAKEYADKNIKFDKEHPWMK